MSLKEKNIVIGTSDTTADYKVQLGTATDFPNIKLADDAITHAWYVPIDNIDKLTRFNHIEVKPDAANVGSVTMRIRCATAASTLRVIIFATTD